MIFVELLMDCCGTWLKTFVMGSINILNCYFFLEVVVYFSMINVFSMIWCMSCIPQIEHQIDIQLHSILNVINQASKTQISITMNLIHLSTNLSFQLI